MLGLDMKSQAGGHIPRGIVRYRPFCSSRGFVPCPDDGAAFEPVTLKAFRLGVRLPLLLCGFVRVQSTGPRWKRPTRPEDVPDAVLNPPTA